MAVPDQRAALVVPRQFEAVLGVLRLLAALGAAGVPGVLASLAIPYTPTVFHTRTRLWAVVVSKPMPPKKKFPEGENILSAEVYPSTPSSPNFLATHTAHPVTMEP